MKAFGYIRVSTEEQAKEGVSLEAQREVIKTYAHFKGIELLDIFEDAGVTTKVPLSRREGGKRLLDAIDLEPGAAVIAYKLDRMFRNTIECLSLIEKWDCRNTAVHFIDLGGQAIDTKSAMGRFFLTLMAAVAELERNQISERTSATLQHKKANGEHTGGFVPWGFSVGPDGKLAVNGEEQNAIAMAVRLRKKGRSLRKIGDELADRDFRPRKNGNWSAEQVKHLLAASNE